MTASPRRTIGATALALGLLVAACSSDADEPAAPSTTTERAEGGGDGGKKDDGDKGDRDRALDCPAPADAGGSARAELVDATEDLGLVEPLLGMYGHATALGDVDADGWLDLYVGTFTDKEPERYQERGAGGRAPDRLLRGGPDGFVVDGDFDPGPGRPSGAAFADLDADGDVDLVIARNVDPDDPDGGDSVVLENDGTGGFTEATTIAEGLGARSVGVLDADRDGLLDLFVVEDRWAGGSSVLLHNEGDLSFRDDTADAGLPDDLAGLAVAAADLGGDPSTDLFVTGANRLFLGDGEGGFEEADLGSTFAWDLYDDEDDVGGVDVGDVDGDGRADLVLGQHFGSTQKGCAVPVRLYLNRGDGTEAAFEDVTEAAGLPGLRTKAPHVELADLDDDGDLDIVASAASGADADEPTVLLQVDGEDGGPVFAAPEALDDERYWVTGVTADLDRDGRLDVFQVDPDPARPSQLWHWDGAQGAAIEVELPADARGVGAVVEVYEAGHGGEADHLLARRELVIGRGYAAGGAAVVHVGIGGADEVDVRVRAHGEDGSEPLEGVAAGRVLRWPADFRG